LALQMSRNPEKIFQGNEANRVFGISDFTEMRAKNEAKVFHSWSWLFSTVLIQIR